MYKKGDRITIECEGRTVEGEVLFASSNGVSLMIQFDALLHGHVSNMPVLMLDGVNGFSVLDSTPVVIRPQ
jgi:hypothetical protein